MDQIHLLRRESTEAQTSQEKLKLLLHHQRKLIAAQLELMAASEALIAELRKLIP